MSIGIVVNMVLWAGVIGWQAPRNKWAWVGYVVLVATLILVRKFDVPILNNCLFGCEE